MKEHAAAAAVATCLVITALGCSAGGDAFGNARFTGVQPATADVSVGDTLQFRRLDAGEGTRVAWTVEDGPRGGTIDDGGNYTAPSTPGTYRVRATADGLPDASAVVTVKRGGAIAITPNPARVLPYGVSELRASVTGLADRGVTWSVAGDAAHGTLTPDGQFFAGDPGVVRVLATSTADPSVQAVAELHVVGDLVDLGGPVLATPTVRAIWWGSAGDFGDAIDAVGGLLSGVSGSRWLATLDQYLRGTPARVTFAGHLFLPGAPSVPQPGRAEVVAAACAALDAQGLPPDANGIYLVFTPAPPADGGPLGTHWYEGSCRGVPISASWISRWAYPAPCSGVSPFAHGAVAVAAHELAESMTNPFPRAAWINWARAEVADWCPFACARIGGAGYAVPALWSNAAQRCVAE